MQYEAGGMVVFLEAEPNDKLLDFYENKNGFVKFAVRYADGDENREMVQLMRLL